MFFDRPQLVLTMHGEEKRQTEVFIILTRHNQLRWPNTVLARAFADAI